MDPIREAHLSEPGLLVIDVAGRDDATVFAFQAAIARLGGTSTAEPTTRDVGQPGVRLRMYTDLRQVLEEGSPPEPTATWKGVVRHHGGSGGPACVHGATDVPGVPGRRVKSP